MSDVEGRFVEASNATLLGETREGERVIYKPIAGARPLWDFDASTLALREVWTHRIDSALGFGVVPETVMGDGVYGHGAVQRFVDGLADEPVVEMINTVDDALWPIAVLDVVINNADRKAGHVLRDGESRLWAIDHGLTFHHEDKLRTVLWGFAGDPIPEGLSTALQSLAGALDGELGAQFREELTEEELRAMIERLSALTEAGCHPAPPMDRPAIPWPPY